MQANGVQWSLLLFLVFVLIAHADKAKCAPSQKQLIKSQWEVLDMVIDRTWDKCLPTYLKYAATYFPRRKPDLSYLGIVYMGENSFTAQERKGSTALIYISKIVKLAYVFRKPMDLVVEEEKQSGGELYYELVVLYQGVRDISDIAKRLHYFITGKYYTAAKLPTVTQSWLDKKVITYKNQTKFQGSVNKIRNWRTLYEVQYTLFDKINVELYNLKDALNI